MLERRIKEIAEKHVNFLSSSSETEQWKDLHLADPALKFKVSYRLAQRFFSVLLSHWPIFIQIVSEASSTLKKPLSNAQLTNILTLKDLIQTLCTPLPKASDAYPITWDLWKGTDHVAEFVKMKKRVSEDALPENVTFKPRKMVKKKSAVAQAV